MLDYLSKSDGSVEGTLALSSLLFGILEEKQVDGSYAIKAGFEDFYYSKKTKKNIALVASMSGVLQQFKGTPLYDSVAKLIYFLLVNLKKFWDLF